MGKKKDTFIPRRMGEIITEELINSILANAYTIVGQYDDAINLLKQNHHILKFNKYYPLSVYEMNKRSLVLLLLLNDRYDEAWIMEND